jgi:hypothetical protein
MDIMKNKCICLLAFLALATAPAVAGQKVLVDWAHNFDFSRPKTITWAPGTPAPNETIESRIRETIEEQLVADGLTFVEPGGKADLIVLSHAVAEEQTKQSNTSVGVGVGVPVGYGTVGVGRSRTGKSKTIKVGTLVIEIRDGVTGELLWQAVASDTIKGNPEKIEAKVVHYMGKAFEQYPPAQK